MTLSAKHILAPTKRYKPSPQVLGSSRFASGGIDSEGRYIRQQTIVEATPEQFEGQVPATSNFQGQNHVLQRGLKSYELTNHLGNVMATVSDRKRQSALSLTALPIELGNECFPSIIGPLLPASAKFFLPDVRSVVDYEPFGMNMPGRSYSSSSYRYGFNGAEKDDEIKGNGNSIEFKFRIYDPRLGRFLSVDPLTQSYPWYTPYQFAGNTPIQAIDIEGAEPLYFQQLYTLYVVGKAKLTNWGNGLSNGVKDYAQGTTGTADYNNVHVPQRVQKILNTQQKIQGATVIGQKAVDVSNVAINTLGSVPGIETFGDALNLTNSLIQGQGEDALAYSAGLLLPGFQAQNLNLLKEPCITYSLIKILFVGRDGQRNLCHYLKKPGTNLTMLSIKSG